MKRHLCVWFPGWPIQRLHHVQPELRERPVVLYAPQRGRMTVVISSERRALPPPCPIPGVRPGMPLAEARALTHDQQPAVHYELHDPRADRALLEALAPWCERFRSAR